MRKHIHASHPEIVKRLRRAEGHLKSTIDMFGNGRSCLDIAQQLFAVEKAITQAKKALIKDHINHCLEDAGGKRPGKNSICELKEITKYL
jgi:DNA-binding FrmR family transcriptional regulator